MPKFQSYDAYIEVEGERLSEYDTSTEVDSNGITRVSCWVPSESGKTFKIRVVDWQSLRPAARFVFKIDGVRLPTARILSANYGDFASSCRKTCCQSVYLDSISAEGGRRELMFSNLELTDDDDALNLRGNAQLGEIHISCTPVRVVGRRLATKPEKSIELLSSKIHEQSKKVGSHNVGLGPVSNIRDPSWTCETEDAGPTLAMFVFRYRPLDFLQAQGIASPPTPDPVPSLPSSEVRADSPEVEIKEEDENEEEEEEEIRRLQERINALKKRKRPVGGKIKAEPVARRPRLSDPEDVIDLTSD